MPIQHTASMGPRVFARGDEVSASVKSANYARFNGATRVRAWRLSVCTECFTRITSFNGATRVRAWRSFCPGLSFGYLLTLQWGHACSRVEICRIERMYGTADQASMGPRVFARGDLCSNCNTGIGLLASMGPRVFARGDQLSFFIARRREMSFNGATRVRAWRSGTAALPASAILVLQWGHACSRVEIPRRLSSCSESPRFNGATRVRAWRFCGASQASPLADSLQWGHACSRVEITRTEWISGATNVLQWGHACSRVEITITETQTVKLR